MKKISDDVRKNIREDREQEGLTLSQLVRKYEISKSSAFSIIQGCDDSKVRRASPSRRVVEVASFKERPKLSKVDIGKAARQMICARLMWNEIKVFRPMTEDTSTDLLVLRADGRVLKCQCKYVFPRQDGCHVMSLSTTRGNSTGTKKHRYSLEEVDFFLGYCQDNDGVFVIPNMDTNGVKQLVFWVSRQAQGNCGKGIGTGRYLNRFDLLK